MSDYTERLNELKAKKNFVKVELINVDEVNDRIESLKKEIGEYKLSTDQLAGILDSTREDVKKLTEGINVTNIKDIELNPTFNTPDVIVPEIKMPTINVPEPTVIKEDDIYSQYKPADIRIEGSTKYYGYLSKTGAWFVMRETGDDTNIKYRYATGKSGFADAFKRKAELDYKYYDEARFE